MSRFIVYALLSILSFSLTADAAEAVDAKAPTAGSPSPESSAQLKSLQDQMNAMVAEMTKIQSTTDPALRLQLMQQHMQSMVAFMTAMHQACGASGQWNCAMGPGMMGSGHMMDGAHGGPMMGGAGGPNVDARLNGIDQRLDLLTQMVDQLVKHEQATQ